MSRPLYSSVDPTEPSDKAPTIHALIEAQVARTPDAAAVSFDGQDWSYAELDARASEIAKAIKAHVSGRGHLVGLSIHRSWEMVACLFGILKSGGGYLPLDPDLPPARLTQIARDAAPVLILGPRALMEPFRGVVGPVLLCVEDVSLQHDRCNNSALSASAPEEGDSLAYVIYTSGSTGQPKGVEVGHASVVDHLLSARQEPGFGPDDVLLSVMRMSFDPTVVDFFLPLSCGARLVLADQPTMTEPTRLASLIARSGATVVQACPPTWRALVDSGWAGSPHLRIWCGGEAMAGSLADRLLERCAELWNVYGPTETTVWSVLHKAARGIAGNVPIGRPSRNTLIDVVDGDLLSVPAGQIGELCVGGAGLALGYRGRPQLTAERFVPLPGRIARAYRTGDLVHADADGLLHYVGRIDDQVKVRGHRIELGEIEAVIKTHPAIADAVITTAPDAIGETALFGYVVFRADCAADLPAVTAFVRERLPQYMVPQRLFSLPTLPVTPNGKTDRKALPSPDTMAEAEDISDLEPATLTRNEEKLAEIWQELLGVRGLTSEDDFFDLGGYSLLTVRLMCAIEETFEREVSIGDLLAASSLSQMARLVEKPQISVSASAILPLQPNGARPPLIWLDGGPLIRTVAREIHPDQPVFGLNLPSSDEHALRDSGFDVAGLAAVLARHLRQAYPAGPYYIGGWCRWGIVAYELCRQLARRDEIALLVLLDADNPRVRRLDWHSRMALWHHRIGTLWPGLAPRKAEPRSFSQIVDTVTSVYRPSTYAGDIALMRPIDADHPLAIDGGWRNLVRGTLTTYMIAGDHNSMVRQPHAEGLGAAINTALERAQTRRPT